MAQRGLAYLFLLGWVATISMVAAHGIFTGAQMGRRIAEQELLQLGMAFEQALHSHGAPPRELNDLINDPRSPGVRRHMRRVRADPLTGSTDWGLVRNAQGGIVGVHSLASGQPIQQQGFEGRWARFNGAARYSDWVFGPLNAQALSPAAPAAPAPPSAAPGGAPPRPAPTAAG